MSRSLLEARSQLIIPKPDVRLYSGLEVAEIQRPDLIQAARAVHTRLGEEKAKGHMHQPPLEKIIDGMETGDYVLSMRQTDKGREFVVATSHIRGAKDDSFKGEIGGVVKLEDVRGQGRAVVESGVQLAVARGHREVDAVVAERNAGARSFFRSLVGSESPDTRKSDYVKDPITGEPVDVVVFDVTKLVQRRAA